MRDDVELGKPDPRLVGLALGKLGISAGQAVMVGDTPYDAEAASGAGIAAAGLLTGGLPNNRYWRPAVSLLRMSCLNYRRSLKQVNEVARARDEA
jgi:phosphoglycolate phosphatase-like HAD superfamily hydrolase